MKTIGIYLFTVLFYFCVAAALIPGVANLVDRYIYSVEPDLIRIISCILSMVFLGISYSKKKNKYF